MTYKKINYQSLVESYFEFDNYNKRIRKILHNGNNQEEIKSYCELAKKSLDKIIQEVWEEKVIEE